MPFLPPNQQRQSTVFEATIYANKDVYINTNKAKAAKNQQ